MLTGRGLALPVPAHLFPVSDLRFEFYGLHVDPMG